MKNLLLISGVNILSKQEQQQLKGGATPDPSKCGCSCSGSVTGPDYCYEILGCLQVYTCGDTF